MTLMIQTYRDPQLVQIVIEIARQMGFEKNNVEGVDEGLWFSTTNGRRIEQWGRVARADKVLDARTASIETIIIELKKILGTVGIKMPFVIRTESVVVFPSEKVVVGCETIHKDKMDAIIQAYQKST